MNVNQYAGENLPAPSKFMRNKMPAVNASPSRSPTILTLNPQLEAAWIPGSDVETENRALKKRRVPKEKGNKMPMPASQPLSYNATLPYPTLGFSSHSWRELKTLEHSLGIAQPVPVFETLHRPACLPIRARRWTLRTVHLIYFSPDLLYVLVYTRSFC